ncbi:MAG: sporulation protein YqfD [Oscillospiraceae bacterium]|nr:sporulation protein YqfD [Oscillospiraceae bacterium]
MKTINYLRGVSEIEICGAAEDVINRVSGEDILLWGAKENEGAVTFYIHTKNVRKLLALYPEAKVTGRGVPEKLKKLRRRAVFLIFTLIFACLWVFSGLLVWEFQVTGNTDVDEYEIIRVLNENGVNYGSVGFLIDSEKLSNAVLCEITELSWFAINVKGSRALISVRERVPKPKIVDPNELTGVYAEKSGLVTSVEVYDGTRLVSVGEEVSAGDMLVSGITSSCTGVRSEHALARIYAQTAYEFTAEMPKNCSFKRYTGEEKVRYGLNICGNVFDFGSGGGENMERYEEQRDIWVFGAQLPVKLVRTSFYGYELYEGQLTTDECAEILKDELSAKLRQENTGDVLWSDFEVCDNGDTVSVTLRAHCYERIG